MNDSATGLRVDRWLFFTRFYRTRSLATAAATSGHVRVNGERAAPGHRVRIGDRIELLRARLPYALQVTGIPARRGPAPEAGTHYVEDEVVATARQNKQAALRLDRHLMPMTEGRPDKHTRRKIRARNRQDETK